MGPQQNYPLNEEAPQNVHNPLGVMQPGERILCEIRRHPFGLFGLYAVGAFMVAISLSVAFIVPFVASFLTAQQKIGVVLSAGLVLIITALITWIGVYVYKGNRW